MLSMEVPAEEFVGSSNDQTVVMRGKRTKRHRPASPFGLAMTCSSSSGGSASSPTTSGGEVYESTEEEEDMANCLILLAQGGVSNGTTTTQQATAAHGSRKFTEIMAATAVKVGFYVYECKTCNRTFPSFQALGGHRASHKKSKTASEAVVVAVEEKGTGHIPVAIPIAQSSAVAVDHRQLDDAKLARNCHSPPLSLQFGNHGGATAVNGKANNNNNNRSNKTHECSICGSEFSSGQALGGHMRRHRTAAVASATTTTTAHQPTTIAVNSPLDYHHRHQGHEEEKKSRNILQLDLNLPAPEDDLRDPPPPSKFQFSSAKQSIVFSAPALVDCHY